MKFLFEEGDWLNPLGKHFDTGGWGGKDSVAVVVRVISNERMVFLWLNIL